ncbi:MAG TPA: DUF6089 family protein [Chitinophagaceae bacterium]
MKHVLTLTGCCLAFLLRTAAQDFSKEASLSLFTGLINYQGDLNPNSFTFAHSHFSVGLSLRKPINRWFTARVGIQAGKIEAADRYNRDYLKPRNLSFYNSITEANLGLELNIPAHQFAPYLLGGIAVFRSNPWAYDNNGNKTFLQPLSTEGQGLPEYPGQKSYGFYHLALMFGGGLRVAVSDNVQVGIEFTQRKSFTDYIDDVSTHFVDRDALLRAKGAKAVEMSYRGDEVPGGVQSYPVHGEQRGTPSEMDWYYFTGITMTVKLSAIGKMFRSTDRIHGSYSIRCPRRIQ